MSPDIRPSGADNYQVLHAWLGCSRAEVDRLTASGRRPVVICSSRVRRHIRRLVEHAFPQLAVVSHNEIVPGVKVESAGLVTA